MFPFMDYWICSHLIIPHSRGAFNSKGHWAFECSMEYQIKVQEESNRPLITNALVAPRRNFNPIESLRLILDLYWKRKHCLCREAYMDLSGYTFLYIYFLPIFFLSFSSIIFLITFYHCPLSTCSDVSLYHVCPEN